VLCELEHHVHVCKIIHFFMNKEVPVINLIMIQLHQLGSLQPSLGKIAGCILSIIYNQITVYEYFLILLILTTNHQAFRLIIKIDIKVLR